MPNKYVTFLSNVTYCQLLLQGAYVMEKSIEDLTADLAESPTTQGRYVGSTTDTEMVLAEVLADVVRVKQVSFDSHFFDDLGANSLVMAQFCARVRKRADLPSVSMKDVYQHP